MSGGRLCGRNTLHKSAVFAISGASGSLQGLLVNRRDGRFSADPKAVLPRCVGCGKDAVRQDTENPLTGRLLEKQFSELSCLIFSSVHLIGVL